MKSKVKAYTILEITIVLFLTGLVVSIGYASFIFFVKSKYQLVANNESIQKLETLHFLLNKEFEEALLIKEESSNTIVFEKGFNRSTQLSFKNDGLEYTNDNGITDFTFIEYENLVVTQENQLVKKIELSTLLNGEHYKYVYIKHYTPDFYINGKLDRFK